MLYSNLYNTHVYVPCYIANALYHTMYTMPQALFTVKHTLNAAVLYNI